MRRDAVCDLELRGECDALGVRESLLVADVHADCERVSVGARLVVPESLGDGLAESAPEADGKRDGDAEGHCEGDAV